MTDPARFGSDALMHDTLGYSKFAIQGGGWGGVTASRLGYAHPDKLIGIHFNRMVVRREPEQFADPTLEE